MESSNAESAVATGRFAMIFVTVKNEIEMREGKHEGNYRDLLKCARYVALQISYLIQREVYTRFVSAIKKKTGKFSSSIVRRRDSEIEFNMGDRIL